VEAVRSPLLKDSYFGSVIFSVVGEAQHPWQEDVINVFRDPLPTDFAAIAYLDFANACARSGRLASHPFNTEHGLSMLQAWLMDEENASYGHSAAASIPFLSQEARDKIQSLAHRHPDDGVRLEAAWAAAKCGEAGGYQTLEAACKLPQQAFVAIQYLTELGAEGRIPLHARSEDFRAMSAMCEWLSHPMEFGRPPKEIRQIDTRELFWPPTNDRRRLWVFLYEYPPANCKTEPDLGYGMVGSCTFALFGESTSNLSINQVYGLHCAWELEKNHDPRAPQKRTPDAGILILKEYNPSVGGF
jgi:hypothetical protein